MPGSSPEPATVGASARMGQFASILSRTGPVAASVLVGAILGGFLLLLLPRLAGMTRHTTVLLAIVLLGTLATVVVGDLRRVLMIALVMAIPINMTFTPGADPLFRSGGAPIGLVIYPYDLPLLGLMVLAVLDVLAGKRCVRFSGIDLAAMALLVCSALSIFSSSNSDAGVFELLRMVKLYLLCRVVASHVRSKQDVRDVAGALLAGLSLQAIISVLQYTMGVTFGLDLFTVGDLKRVSGTVGWPNTFGAYVATILSLGLVLWLGDGISRRFKLLGLVCITGFVPLVLSFSRGAWLSVFVGMLVGVVLLGRRRWLSGSAAKRLAGVSVTGALVGGAFAGPIIERVSEVSLRLSTLVDRGRLNQVALNMIRERPALGIGLNNFVDVMKQFDTTGVTNYFPEPVHNIFLMVAAETGLLGLTMFLFLFLAATKEALRASDTVDRELSVMAIALISGILVLGVDNLADVHLRTDVLYSLFWLLIGLLAAVRRLSAHTDRLPLVPSESHGESTRDGLSTRVDTF